MPFHMKLTVIIICLTGLFTFVACGQNRIKPSTIPMDKFKQFKARQKFTPDSSGLYTGLGDKSLLPILNEKMNLLADDFAGLANKQTATPKDYQQRIKIGLNRFSSVYNRLGTEDRERLCNYVEELMDIVGLDSSDGLLNNFMYGFDPTSK